MANERARALRTNSTDAERKLWRFLRTLKDKGHHFRRQAPIDQFIVDFVCYSTRLIIEVDGGQHNMAAGQKSDASRDAYLRQQNFRVLRFWNHDVLQNLNGVSEVIVDALSVAPPPPTPPRKGEGSSKPQA